MDVRVFLCGWAHASNSRVVRMLLTPSGETEALGQRRNKRGTGGGGRVLIHFDGAVRARHRPDIGPGLDLKGWGWGPFMLRGNGDAKAALPRLGSVMCLHRGAGLLRGGAGRSARCRLAAAAAFD